MALVVYVNSVNVNSLVPRRTLVIDKDGAIETAQLTVRDEDITSTAFRLAPGDELFVERDGSILEFGGRIGLVTNRTEPAGTFTEAEAVGHHVEAYDVHVLGWRTPTGPLYTSAKSLIGHYLADKGWTTPTMAAGGGPTINGKYYRDTTVGDILDDLAERSGLPWRVNGDRWGAFTYLGEIAAPTSYTQTNAIVLKPMTWSQDRIQHATRLFVTTGGSREWFSHWEDEVADGVRTHFPRVVLPPECEVTVANSLGYAAGVTSLSIAGLPPSFTVRPGVTLWADTHGPYSLASSMTSDADGAGIIVLSSSLTEALEYEQRLTFERGAMVEWLVNSATVALDGTAGWTFDSTECQVVTSSTAPTSGTATRYLTRLKLPATVRQWTSGITNADGAFNYNSVVDARETWAQYDAWESAWLDASTAASDELNDRPATAPKEARILTFHSGQVYPWMSASVSFTDHDLDGTFNMRRVVLTDTGRADQVWQTEIQFTSGQWVTRPWGNYWTGGVTTPFEGAEQVVETMEWTTNPQYTAPSAAAAVSVTPSASSWSNSSYVEVIAATDADCVLTGVTCVTYGVSTVPFEVDVAVGGAGAETVIATLKGWEVSNASAGNGYMPIPVPIDAIASGARVAIRMRKLGTNTNAWAFAITYLKKPITGSLTTTTKALKCLPSAADHVQLTSNTTAWASGAWVTISASAPADLVLVGAVWASRFVANVEHEIDIGVGGAGAETVIATFRGFNVGTTNDAPLFEALATPITDAIAAGDRIAARWRKAGTSSSNLSPGVAIVYYEAPL